MDLVVLVMLLALVEYIVLGALVGRARGRYGVRAPAITGHEVFERTFRVHQNTLEGLVVFLPALWLAGLYSGTTWAAGLGIVGIAGRAIYAVGYIKAADKRGPGAMICGIVNAALVISALIGVVRSLL